MRIADPCGCFPTGRHYPGIADRMVKAAEHVAGMAHGFEADTAWARAAFAVIDFETTGLDPEKDRVIEVGVALFRDGAFERGENWLIQPGMPIPAASTDVNGITDEMVKDAPSFADVWRAVAAVLEGRIPVAYNHRFDTRFFWAELARAGAPTSGVEVPPAFVVGGVWIDPLVWAREIQKGERGFSLVDVSARLGISLENAHRAAHDAEATGKVLLALAERMPARYAELLRVQQRYHAAQDLEAAAWRNRRGGT